MPHAGYCARPPDDAALRALLPRVCCVTSAHACRSRSKQGGTEPPKPPCCGVLPEGAEKRWGRLGVFLGKDKAAEQRHGADT